MSSISLLADWHGGYEYMTIDLAKARSKVTTREHWPAYGIWREYATTCELTRLGHGRIKAVLDHSRHLNKPLWDTDARFGQAVVVLDTESATFEAASWLDYDDSGKFYSGKARSCRILSDTGPLRTLADVVYEETKRIRRKDATRLRNALYGEYGCCAFSGETTKDALDVAHIWEVHREGSNSRRNVFLLRTDLHRLFDSHVLNFSHVTGQPTFTGLHAKSRYQAELGQRALCPVVLARVADALKERARMRVKRAAPAP